MTLFNIVSRLNGLYAIFSEDKQSLRGFDSFVCLRYSSVFNHLQQLVGSDSILGGFNLLHIEQADNLFNRFFSLKNGGSICCNTIELSSL